MKAERTAWQTTEYDQLQVWLRFTSFSSHFAPLPTVSVKIKVTKGGYKASYWPTDNLKLNNKLSLPTHTITGHLLYARCYAGCLLHS